MASCSQNVQESKRLRLDDVANWSAEDFDSLGSTDLDMEVEVERADQGHLLLQEMHKLQEHLQDTSDAWITQPSSNQLVALKLIALYLDLNIAGGCKIRFTQRSHHCPPQ